MVLAISPTRPDLAIDIIAGTRILQSNTEFKPVATDRKTSADSVLGNTFSGDLAPVRDTVLDAADALYAFRASQGGSTIFNSSEYETGIMDVVGGILKSGNQSIMAPIPDMTQGRLNDLLDALSADDLVEFSIGQAVPLFADGDPFTADLFDKSFFSPGVDAELVSTGFGKYAISNPGSGLMLDANGKLYELDLRAYHESGKADIAIEKKTPPPLAFQQEDKTGLEAFRERGRTAVGQKKK